MKLGHICQTAVVTTLPGATLAQAAKAMRAAHVGALVVTEQRENVPWPVGIITDRDIAVAVTRGASDAATQVADVMTRRLVTAFEHDDFFDGLSKMRRFGIRRLPIIAPDGRLRGIITLDDVIEVLSAKLREAASIVPRELRVEERELRTS